MLHNSSFIFLRRGKKGAITFASADDKTPLIVYGEKKGGRVAYYGIMDQISDFKTLPSLPNILDNNDKLHGKDRRHKRF